jgi:murein DD-endopeptidase MepM/ murein hydrolase activator NlpD
MRSVAEVRSRLFVRAAAVALLAAGAAGCTGDMSRFADSPFSNSMAARATPAPVEHTASAPTGRIDSQPLPAPAGANVASTGAYAAPAASPRVASHAPITAPSHQSEQAGGVHVVAPGETLSSIARLYGKSRHEIAKANKIDVNIAVRIGQRLTVPGVSQAKIKQLGAPPSTLAAQATKPATAKPEATPAPVKMAAAPATATARLASPATETPAEAAPAAVAETTGAVPSFRWPVRGRVITEFGAKTPSGKNDGINVSVPEGTSVKAAEDGVVAYAGNELKGYGNLVLVRHSNGFVTAYAHASDIAVKRGDQVKRGQIIARAGQTGSVSSPQLHFEIRKGSTPVDPAQYLTQ